MGSTHAIGIVGLGVISRAYLDTLAGHPGIRIAAVADLDASRAEATAAEIEGCRALTTAELMADSDIDTVLNLTIPAAHAEVALAAISAGKAVFGEKPLAASFAEAQTVMDAAEQAGVPVGCAPDTVLGTGVQTARAAVDGGMIGSPVGATASWVSPGHEHWHPAPDFYYQAGGGPLLDMGPYYVTSLVQLLGPVVAVSGAASRAHRTRVIATGPRAGESVRVEVDTHIAGVLEHAGGAISTITMSFDGVATSARPIEVYGTEGALTVPDPNMHAGEVRVRMRGADDWSPVPVSAGYEHAARGIGLLDFVAGDRRASGDMALHVLDVMESLHRAAADHARVVLATTVERPPVVPLTASASA
ncbi:Gfo/Idh/MocA family protein [Microbacterium sp. C7(2022)]|uniref:Gfo/Idh/MocA family protein n=1 Tax=Microbacterium sp. C7(2022) TaxID=2992759 RepID=UPI00237B34A0|nr:Gfo/Idh/MocA family oxidoreductase [Microbacterium sp. C7(2022)]MDE0545228.1 Gfo/Idh/MocA family oxidoreductase [Microbacterium sp. C7(2022)]